MSAAGKGREVRLFLDCDGVLADFDAASSQLFGFDDAEERVGAGVFWKTIEKARGGFFRRLPLMPEAMKLFGAVKHMRPTILTGCPYGGWAEPQKVAWAAEHFPGTRVITCKSSEKSVYCDPGDVLVDDVAKYAHLWEARGGVFVLYDGSAPRALERLAELPGWVEP